MGALVGLKSSWKFKNISTEFVNILTKLTNIFKIHKSNCVFWYNYYEKQFLFSDNLKDKEYLKSVHHSQHIFTF